MNISFNDVIKDMIDKSGGIERAARLSFPVSVPYRTFYKWHKGNNYPPEWVQALIIYYYLNSKRMEE